MGNSIIDKLDDSFPEAKYLRGLELDKQIRDMFFNTVFGKMFGVIMISSIPASILFFKMFLDFNLSYSILLGLVFFYFFVYLFLYGLVTNPLRKNLEQQHNKNILESVRKVEESGVSMEDMLNR
jgi:hypothetical protein